MNGRNKVLDAYDKGYKMKKEEVKYLYSVMIHDKMVVRRHKVLACTSNYLFLKYEISGDPILVDYSKLWDYKLALLPEIAVHKTVHELLIEKHRAENRARDMKIYVDKAVEMSKEYRVREFDDDMNAVDVEI